MGTVPEDMDCAVADHGPCFVCHDCGAHADPYYFGGFHQRPDGRECECFHDSTVPEFMPVLSSGGHDSPAEGACVMEYVSLLAGEEWSDSPACTHPVLAAMARRVNDLLPDERRGELVPLIGRLFGTADTRDDEAARRALSVSLAEWSARQVAHLRSHAYASVDAAYAVTDAAAAYAVTYAAAANAAANAAHYAASAVDHGGEDLVALLTGLLDEYDRLTGHTPTTVHPAHVEQLRLAAAGK